MSQAQKTEQKTYEDVSLDEFVLVSIMQYLQNATSLALERDYEGAIEACEYVWSILPKGVASRKELEKSPLKDFEETVNAKVPPFEEIIKNFKTYQNDVVRLAYPLSEDDFENYPYGEETKVAIAKYRMAWQIEIAKPIIRNFRRIVVEGLESAGLYIQGKRRIIPTADRKPDEPMPILAKLGPSIPRK